MGFATNTVIGSAAFLLGMVFVCQVVSWSWERARIWRRWMAVARNALVVPSLLTLFHWTIRATEAIPRYLKHIIDLLC